MTGDQGDDLVCVLLEHSPVDRSLIECACGADFGDDRAWAEHVAQAIRQASGYPAKQEDVKAGGPSSSTFTARSTARGGTRDG